MHENIPPLSRSRFDELIEEGMLRIPEQFHAKIRNVAVLVEQEPDAATRTEQGLLEGETLLGLYRGIPRTERGSDYGVGMTLPDTITLYQFPIEAAAHELVLARGILFEEAVRAEVADTVWHEVAHYFGMDEDMVMARETERDTARGKEGTRESSV